MNSDFAAGSEPDTTQAVSAEERGLQVLFHNAFPLALRSNNHGNGKTCRPGLSAWTASDFD